MVNPEAQYLEPLNERQLEAVIHEGAPLLILAGAGSGKTRVITTKIAWLIESRDIKPWEILAVTFTNKAANEMRERATAMVSEASSVLIRTFHSFGAWLLRRNADTIGLHPRFTIYDDDDASTLLHGLFPQVPKREMGRYVNLISRAKDYCLSPLDDLGGISFDPNFAEYYGAYQGRLEEMGNADFGDLIMKPVTMLDDNEKIREWVHNRFKVILVDEYQDSNVAQFALLEQLTGPSTYLCVVGDDDQSIYRFRGAEVKNILTFSDAFSGTEIVRLEQNYRSKEPILNLASEVVANNTGRLGKKLWTAREGGKKPLLVFLQNQEEEARYCAELLSDGRLEDTAILYRTNAQSLAFEKVFTQKNIPYRLIGALSFYEREEIKDCLAYLSLFANPMDEIAFRRIINKPSRGIGEVNLNRILSAAMKAGGDLLVGSQAAIESLSTKASKGVEVFVKLFADLKASLSEVSLSKFLQMLVVSSGLSDFHKGQDEISGTTKVGNLEELVNASVDYPPGVEGLVIFLEHLELDRSRFDVRGESEGARVTLITMHNTKGLEFRRVVISGLEEGVFPGWRDEEEDDYEEERRIFYVSITRAKDELYLTTCATRRIWGRIKSHSPSSFLREVPPELFDQDRGGTTGVDSEMMNPGDRIYHDDYGSGTIVRSWYNEGQSVVQVQFDTGRSARFLPEYTPLERISSDD